MAILSPAVPLTRTESGNNDTGNPSSTSVVAPAGTLASMMRVTSARSGKTVTAPTGACTLRSAARISPPGRNRRPRQTVPNARAVSRRRMEDLPVRLKFLHIRPGLWRRSAGIRRNPWLFAPSCRVNLKPLRRRDRADYRTGKHHGGPMAKSALVSVICEDRTGLIAAITGRMFDLGINLGDTTFAVLGTGAEFTTLC